jgi:hypothetical protein
MEVYRSGNKSTNIVNINTGQSLIMSFMLQLNEKSHIPSFLKNRKYNARLSGCHLVTAPSSPQLKVTVGPYTHPLFYMTHHLCII